MRNAAAVLLAVLFGFLASTALGDDGKGAKPAPKTTKEAAPLRKPDARFERVATGFGFTEGPAAAADGTLVFSDIRGNRIHRFDARTGKTSIVREDSGGTNGLAFATDGALIACEGGRRQVVRLVLNRGGGVAKSTVMASHWGKKRLNSPNDLALDAHGGVWFTDPRYGRKRDDREIDIEAVYYRDATGAVHQRITDVPKPNGILLSADGATLYVADSTGRRVVAYPVTGAGTVGPRRAFAGLDRHSRGGPDGLTLDARGNVYGAGQGHIWVWSQAGVQLGKWPVPESPTNCTFGGIGGRTLFVTARTSLYRMPMLVGAAPRAARKAAKSKASSDASKSPTGK
jgi:gluconolactonase